MENQDGKFVVAVPLANIRREPDEATEQVTQALMNTPASPGEVSGEWTRVTLPDYEGWIRTSALAEPIVRGYCAHDEGVCGVALPYSVVVTVPRARLYVREEGEENLGELYLSTVLPYIDLEHAQRLRVALPGNGEGWLAREDVAVRENADLFPRQEIQIVTSYAKALLGVPYLWGGISCQGIDCSGFVQLCYRMGGTILPRDAHQQHDALTHSVSREEMRVGDLLFFGKERVTHVALALNRHEYIHAAGGKDHQVTINSLDPAHPLYNAARDEQVCAIKRVRDE